MFLRTESVGGVALIAATAAALVWANVAGTSYGQLWSTHLSLPGPDHALTLHSWVNDGLMAIFFFVVGLEIKREIVDGELSDPRTAAVPIAAALGGMLVPAIIYVAVTAGTAHSRGWGIPMATDIAFALAVLRSAKRRAPSGLGIILLTLAIVDDLGAIIVIAIFYSSGVKPAWLLIAAIGMAAIIAARRRFEHPGWFVIPAVVIWICFSRSGVHATLAGVVLGLATPLRSRSGTPVLEPLEHALTPWSNFVVLPIFALANAGVILSGARLHAAATSPVAWGIALGLIVGKFVGITGSTWLAVRLGGRLPSGLGARSIVALGLLGGIGFTVSLFIATLAFSGPLLQTAKIAVFAASIVSGVAAAVLLRTIRPAAKTST